VGHGSSPVQSSPVVSSLIRRLLSALSNCLWTEHRTRPTGKPWTRPRTSQHWVNIFLSSSFVQEVTNWWAVYTTHNPNWYPVYLGTQPNPTQPNPTESKTDIDNHAQNPPTLSDYCSWPTREERMDNNHVENQPARLNQQSWVHHHGCFGCGQWTLLFHRVLVHELIFP